MKKQFLHYNSAKWLGVCLAIVALYFLSSATVRAQDLVKIEPVTNKILMVTLDEGNVDYHDVYGQNASSIAYANPINTANAENKANYLLSSIDDSNYSTAKTPLNLGRKAKPQDIVDFYATGMKAVLNHYVYIELPTNLVRGKTYTLTVNNVVQNRNTITFVYDEKELLSPTVHVNQVGFSPNGVKYAYLSQWMGSFNTSVHANGGLKLESHLGNSFQVLRASDNAVVFTGTIAKRKDKSTTETNNTEFGATRNFTNADVWECNFSGFTTPGQYYVAVDNIGRSQSFEIAESAYRHAYQAVSKAIFTQRQGVDKELEGGLVYPRGHHPDDRNVWFTGTTTKVNVWGYYYDAGDWDGHNRHIGVPMDLMLLYDFQPENFKDGDVANRYRLSSTTPWIAEGTDGLPDVLNEAKWLVSFYKRAKDALIAAGKGTGGVIGGRLPNQNGVYGEGYIGPDAGVEGRNSWTDTRPVYVNAEQTANTLLYSGAAAYYAVVLNKFNNGTVTTESNSWRSEAINAYNWADARSDDEVGEDNIKSKILGSACLYRLTGEVKYLNDLKRLLPMDPSYPGNDAYQRLETWQYAAMIIGKCPSNHPNLDVAFQTTLKNHIIGHADNDYLNPANARGFRFGFNLYRSTSNGAFSVPRMQMVAFAYEMTGDAKYLEQVQHAANYTLGGNENNMTYVSGLGHNPDEKTFHPDAWKLIDFNSKVYTNTIFPGYVNYYAMKTCDWMDGCGFQFSGDEDFSRSLASPGISAWPAGEWRMNNKYSIAGSEFTMDETLAQAAFTYGYLAGTASASFINNTRPTVSLNLTQSQAFPKSGCNLTVASSADTRLVKYYYDWHFIGESTDRSSNFSFFWAPPQAAGTSVAITAVGYDDRGLISRPTTDVERTVTISTSASCSSSTIAVTGVTISPTTATVNEGATQQLIATLAPSNATNKNVTWSSSNTSIASVNSSGLVTGVAPGTVTITVTTQDGGKTAAASITVTSSPTVAVTGVTVSPTTATIGVGSTQQIIATVAPSNATNKNVSWNSSNTSIATVNSSGLVTGVAAGTATITVTTQDGAKTATSTVSVNQTANPQIISSIAGASESGNPTVNSYDGNASTRWANDGTLPNAWIEYTLDNTYNLTSVNLLMFNNSSRTYPIEISVNGSVVWSGSTVMTSGVWARSISATGNKVRIRMTGSNSSGTNWFSINEITISGTASTGTVAVTGITVSPTSASIGVGTTQQLTASISPSNATNKTVTWSSSNTTIASVNNTGVVTGLAAGTATVTVTTQDGAKTATSVITVSGSSVTPLVKLRFNENTGTTATNTGSVGGSLSKTTPPNWSTNVPASGGTSSLDFGTSTGNYVVESGAVISQLGGLANFTITGWVNARNNLEGGGGNRIVTWINAGGNGVDLVYHSDGSLQLGINQWPDSSPARSNAAKITTDANAGTANWKFFAVTYNSSTSTVQFFFGSNTSSATLDVTRTYSRGAVGAAIGRLAIGHFNSATRSSALDRMFRGLIDEVTVYSQVLSAAQIQSVQTNSDALGRQVVIGEKPNFDEPVLVYPNPVQGNDLNISAPTSVKSFTAQLLNSHGQLINEKSYQGSSGLMSVSEIANGLYILKVNYGASNRNVKVIIQK